MKTPFALESGSILRDEHGGTVQIKHIQIGATFAGKAFTRVTYEWTDGCGKSGRETNSVEQLVKMLTK